MASTKELDAIADRLGALYQLFGRIDVPACWCADMADALDELARVTADLEAATGRKKRERNDRKRERRIARRAASASQQNESP